MANTVNKLWVQAYEWIKDGITSGRLKPEEPLSENRLSKEIQISRTPIREALMVLEQEGYVKLLPSKGAFVTKISLEDVKEIYDIRKLLEPFVALSAVFRIPDSEIQKLEDLWNSIKKRLDSGEVIKWTELAKADKDFHFTLIRYSSNKRVKQMLTSCHAQIERFQSLSAESFADIENTIQQHVILVTLLKQKDADKLSQTLYEHILRGESKLLSEYVSRL